MKFLRQAMSLPQVYFVDEKVVGTKKAARMWRLRKGLRGISLLFGAERANHYPVLSGWLR